MRVLFIFRYKDIKLNCKPEAIMLKSKQDKSNRTETLTKGHSIIWPRLQSTLIANNSLLRHSQSLENAKETSCFSPGARPGFLQPPQLTSSILITYLIHISKIQVCICKCWFQFHSFLRSKICWTCQNQNTKQILKATKRGPKKRPCRYM